MAARANALLAGRDFVHPDDIKAISLPVLRHRISLAPEMELEGFNTDQILSAILEKRKPRANDYPSASFILFSGT